MDKQPCQTFIWPDSFYYYRGNCGGKRYVVESSFNKKIKIQTLLAFYRNSICSRKLLPFEKKLLLCSWDLRRPNGCGQQVIMVSELLNTRCVLSEQLWTDPPAIHHKMKVILTGSAEAEPEEVLVSCTSR